MAYSQDNFLIYKNGTKVDIKTEGCKFLSLDKQVYLTLVGQSRNTVVDFADIKELRVSGLFFNNFVFKENFENYCFFVVAQSLDYQLISITVPEPDVDICEAEITHFVYVLNNDGLVQESFQFTNKNSVKASSNRKYCFEMIKSLFTSCTAFSERFIDSVASDTSSYSGLCEFFSVPFFVSCK